MTNIIFNIGYRGKISFLEATGCYNPRNAVLFFDSKNNLLEFIELCFECQGHRLSSDKIELGDLCNQKYTLLKEFFSKAGIQVGTVKELQHQGQTTNEKK